MWGFDVFGLKGRFRQPRLKAAEGLGRADKQTISAPKGPFSINPTRIVRPIRFHIVATSRATRPETIGERGVALDFECRFALPLCLTGSRKTPRNRVANETNCCDFD